MAICKHIKLKFLIQSTFSWVEIVYILKLILKNYIILHKLETKLKVYIKNISYDVNQKGKKDFEHKNFF